MQTRHERYDEDSKGKALREEFLSLLDRAPVACRMELETELLDARLAVETGEPLASLLTVERLTRARLRERAGGAPSNKIAHAQVHRNLSRSILSTLATLWLLHELVPASHANRTVRIAKPEPDSRRAAAGFADVRSGSIADLGAAIADVTHALEAVSIPRARILPALRRSNCAIAIAAPYLVVLRHGGPAHDMRPALARFLGSVAPRFAGEIFWRDPGAPGESPRADLPEPRAIRVTCCLKYTCAARRFCGTCPKRD
ncbi:(2Fe-2S)-binding protein [Fulvimarina sp. MAC3]|uniref:(2Fe-2S)-binding protein n=1 Tax=Fulvimarina sp. MAC3 TaxID=3148887 RepID=UPI0031FBBDF1